MYFSYNFLVFQSEIVYSTFTKILVICNTDICKLAY